MKYRPNYPATFTDIDAARAWVSSYVPWYNEQHRPQRHRTIHPS
jgi:putative transposase